MKQMTIRDAAIGAALALGAASTFGLPAARGQFAVTTQSRSVSGATAAPTASDNQSDMTVQPGPYTGTKTSALDVFIPTGAPAPNDQAECKATGTATQTSAVAAAGLSGTGSAYVYTVQGGLPNGQTTSAALSLYSAQFTVAAPTPVALAGSLTGTTYYHLGPLETLTDEVSLVGSASGTLFDLAQHNLINVGYGAVPFTFASPIAYATTLQPGQVYTLTATASLGGLRTGVGQSLGTPANTAFAFSLAVPEPASAAVVLAGVAGLASRRRIRR